MYLSGQILLFLLIHSGAKDEEEKQEVIKSQACWLLFFLVDADRSNPSHCNAHIVSILSGNALVH